MEAHDKPETETVYDVYIHIDNTKHFCKRYHRREAAFNLCTVLDLKYGRLGYTTSITPVEIAPARLG
ncbi:MAG: hypothetical protein KKF27_20650, partial [Gammaproteobacteria bacterium]|nr:hypothetical protein [Gammaproteobacteria bacterium]MBU2685659.1 hypothetical protein [Gammaproteobacteria bacterium]